VQILIEAGAVLFLIELAGTEVFAVLVPASFDRDW